MNNFYRCPVRIKIQGERLTVRCLPESRDVGTSLPCNGHASLCGLRFNEVTFPGTHNAGTGEEGRMFKCAFKNHDLNVREQLDFGIRFFDFDVIFSNSNFFCNGLETGHGKKPGNIFFKKTSKSIF